MIKDLYYKKTGLALLTSAILKEPLFSLYGLIAFIMRKDLAATTLELSILTMLRPMVSILSYYWSSFVANRSDRLKPNFLWAGFLSYLPFLFLFWINSSWYVIFAVTIYIMFHRAGAPAWTEVLKLNMSKEGREKIFSWSSAVGYLVGVCLALIFGATLEKNPSSWKLLFFVSAILGMINVLVLSKVPIRLEKKSEEVFEKKPFKENLLKPWIDSFYLMKNKPEFAKFQWGYMINGVGLMIIQPVLPIFCVDYLKLSHSEYAIAYLICRGLGFIISSPIWGKMMGKISIMKFSINIFVITVLFMVSLILASFHVVWLYLGFCLYGITQGGNHLLWNLSGIFFAENEDSSRYSSVSVVSVSLRGSVVPPIGGLLTSFMHPLGIFALGAGFCFYSVFFLAQKKFFAVKKNF
ncbi:MAG: MFS transporter [Chlamydiae bacterium]|nr:MFS transporter [Chlamydiota bacterium]